MTTAETTSPTAYPIKPLPTVATLGVCVVAIIVLAVFLGGFVVRGDVLGFFVFLPAVVIIGYLLGVGVFIIAGMTRGPKAVSLGEAGLALSLFGREVIIPWAAIRRVAAVPDQVLLDVDEPEKYFSHPILRYYLPLLRAMGIHESFGLVPSLYGMRAKTLAAAIEARCSHLSDALPAVAMGAQAGVMARLLAFVAVLFVLIVYSFFGVFFGDVILEANASLMGAAWAILFVLLVNTGLAVAALALFFEILYGRRPQAKLGWLLCGLLLFIGAIIPGMAETEKGFMVSLVGVLIVVGGVSLVGVLALAPWSRPMGKAADRPPPGAVWGLAMTANLFVTFGLGWYHLFNPFFVGAPDLEMTGWLAITLLVDAVRPMSLYVFNILLLVWMAIRTAPLGRLLGGGAAVLNIAVAMMLTYAYVRPGQESQAIWVPFILAATLLLAASAARAMQKNVSP